MFRVGTLIQTDCAGREWGGEKAASGKKLTAVTVHGGGIINALLKQAFCENR